MQRSDAASTIAIALHRPEYFLVYYEWMTEEDIPMDVTDVRIYRSKMHFVVDEY